VKFSYNPPCSIHRVQFQPASALFPASMLLYGEYLGYADERLVMDGSTALPSSQARQLEHRSVRRLQVELPKGTRSLHKLELSSTRAGKCSWTGAVSMQKPAAPQHKSAGPTELLERHRHPREPHTKMMHKITAVRHVAALAAAHHHAPEARRQPSVQPAVARVDPSIDQTAVLTQRAERQLEALTHQQGMPAAAPEPLPAEPMPAELVEELPDELPAQPTTAAAGTQHATPLPPQQVLAQAAAAADTVTALPQGFHVALMQEGTKMMAQQHCDVLSEIPTEYLGMAHLQGPMTTTGSVLQFVVTHAATVYVAFESHNGNPILSPAFRDTGKTVLLSGCHQPTKLKVFAAKYDVGLVQVQLKAGSMSTMWVSTKE